MHVSCWDSVKCHYKVVSVSLHVSIRVAYIALYNNDLRDEKEHSGLRGTNSVDHRIISANDRQSYNGIMECERTIKVFCVHLNKKRGKK